MRAASLLLATAITALTQTAHAQVMMDVAANDITKLKPADYRGIERYRVGQQYQRGVVMVVFPGNKQEPLVGPAAEQYIKTGLPLQGVVYGGMPVSEYGIAAWARQNLDANNAHTLKLAKASPVLKRALSEIARENPTLTKASRELDLSSSGLGAALDARAASDKALNQVWSTLKLELAAPIAGIVNGFGVPDAGDGKKNYHEVIRPQNERGKPGADPVDAKMANLLLERYRTVARNLGLDRLPVGQLAGMLARPELRLLTGTTLIGHCAGASNSSNTAMHLAALVDQNQAGFPLGKAFLRALRVVGYGAAFNVPKGIGSSAFFVGTEDQFGRLNSPSKAIAENSRAVERGHMMNLANRDSMRDLDQLETKATNEVFGLDPFRVPAKDLEGRRLSLLATAERYASAGRDQAAMLKRFQQKELFWQQFGLTSAVTKESLRGWEKIYAARAERAQALVQVLAARLLKREAKAIAASDPARARTLEREAAAKSATAWQAVRDAKRSERWARSSMLSSVAAKEMLYNWHGMAPGLEYKYIHEVEPNDRKRRLGEKELARRNAVGAAVGKTLQYQLISSSVKAKLGQAKVIYPHLNAEQKTQIVAGARQMRAQLRQAREQLRAK